MRRRRLGLLLLRGHKWERGGLLFCEGGRGRRRGRSQEKGKRAGEDGDMERKDKELDRNRPGHDIHSQIAEVHNYIPYHVHKCTWIRIWLDSVRFTTSEIPGSERDQTDGHVSDVSLGTIPAVVNGSKMAYSCATTLASHCRKM